ncbi:MAG: response regulator transcription factor [Actinobacteria bacterium]|nr:response regulator transcription factor [Actinomycetota bacterium]
MNAGFVLVVDDDPIARDVLSRYLARGGFKVATAEDGEAAVAAFEAQHPDLVLLDLMLPGIDGFGVFDMIRRTNSTPVIMLTAKGEEADRIAGLDVGADDYIAKPFSPKEVVARVRAVLRRVPKPQAQTLGFDDLVIEGGSRRVTLAGDLVTLTPREFDLLYLMASHPSRVFSRVELLDELWDFAFEGDPSTVTVHMRRLREKVEPDASRPRHLMTVWGAGYRFDP